MAPVLLGLSWLAGLGLGRVARPDRPGSGGAAIAAAALFGGAAVGPAGLSVLYLAPDWALLYLALPAHGALGLTAVAFPAASVGAAVLGCMATSGLGARGAGLVAGASGAALLALLAWSGRRLTVMTTYAAFHGGGSSEPLVASAVFLPLVGVAAVLAGVYVFTLVHLRRA